MNYFAHGVRFLDRPWFLAGTAIPDLLSVADRRTRIRPRPLEAVAAEVQGEEAELVAGIFQHLHDDHWFHRTAGFYEVTGRLTRLFRESLPEGDGYRPSFLGHIITELLLDDVLARQHPGGLDRYYEALSRIDIKRVQAIVNRAARNPTDRLAPLFPRFIAERFLYDYHSPERMLFRLNQVLRRIKLNPLPDELTAVLAAGQQIVTDEIDALLPPEHFRRSPDG